MGLSRIVATAGTLAVMVVMALAAPAPATIFERGSFSFDETFEENLCGIQVIHHEVFTADFRTRTGKGDLDQAFFGMLKAQFSDTFTNVATGASFTIEGHGVLNKDVKATPLGGNIFAFKVLEASTVVVRDLDGKVVLRDAGSIWRTIVFDTLGDSQPGGEVLSESIIRVNGPHPLFNMDEATFCAMVHDLIG